MSHQRCTVIASGAKRMLSSMVTFTVRRTAWYRQQFPKPSVLHPFAAGDAARFD